MIMAMGALAFLSLPWWMTAIGGIVAGLLLPSSSGKAFALGFAAGFLLWWGSAFFFSNLDGGLLAGKMGEVFRGLKSWQLLSAAGIAGGLLAGLGNLTGVLFREMLGFTTK